MKNTDYEQIHLDNYIWENFSLFDSIKHKIHLFFVWFFCTFFKSHDWIIMIGPWNISELVTVEDFRKHRAKLLMCSCCNTIKHINDAKLSQAEMFAYKHHTYKYFKCN